jgi:hypothetical protein
MKSARDLQALVLSSFRTAEDASSVHYYDLGTVILRKPTTK